LKEVFCPVLEFRHFSLSFLGEIERPFGGGVRLQPKRCHELGWRSRNRLKSSRSSQERSRPSVW